MDDNIGDGASITIASIRAKVSAFAEAELASVACLSFTELLMLTVVIVVTAVMIGAFSLRLAVAIER